MKMFKRQYRIVKSRFHGKDWFTVETRACFLFPWVHVDSTGIEDYAWAAIEIDRDDRETPRQIFYEPVQ